MTPLSLSIFCQRFPYPPRRGDQLAVSKMIDYCAANEIFVDVFVCSLSEGDEELSHLKDYVKFHRLSFSIFALLRNLITNPFDPLQVLLFSGYRCHYPDKLRDSIIYLHTLRMTRVVPSRLLGKVFMGAQIDFANEFAERALTGTWLVRLLYYLESRLLISFQHRMLSRFRSVFRVTADEFAEYELKNIKTFPHGIDPDRVVSRRETCQRDNEYSGKLVIGFWGNFDFAPNAEAFETLIKWKTTSCRHDQIRIFGRGSSKLVCLTESAELIGEVDNMDDEIDKCDVLVNLVTTGGGFQNKTIEAWARGVPVVGFWQAFRGLSDVGDIAIVVKEIDEIDRALDDLAEGGMGLSMAQSWVKKNWDQKALTQQKFRYMGLG